MALTILNTLISFLALQLLFRLVLYSAANQRSLAWVIRF